MIIAGRVKKIKRLSKKFRKKKNTGEFVVFFCYKLVFLEYIIEKRTEKFKPHFNLISPRGTK